MTPAETLKQTLTLPCGATLPNRFMKSAMSEVLADDTGAPNIAHGKLYQTWSQGGTGLVITGNVMVDSRYRGEIGNVVLEEDSIIPYLKRWSEEGRVKGNHLWTQINHPGKQIPNLICKEPVAPSEIPLKLPFFNKPRALEESEIEDIIKRFGKAAQLSKEGGFSGAQIHGAHGYLVNQFLSPKHNQREDQWGGSLENRMRFLVEIYHAMRNEVGPDFPVGVKLNSADFQRGGFTEEEALQVIQKLSELGMDLIEISGGTYEAPAMVGSKKEEEQKESTKKREAYFLKFAEQVRQVSKIPLAVTGGFRTAQGMAEAVSSGAIDIVGLARPLAVAPDLPNRIFAGEDFESSVKKRISTGIRAVDDAFMLDITWYERQLALMGEGRPPQPNLSPWKVAFRMMSVMGKAALVRRRA